MTDTTWGGRTRYQGYVSNIGKGFVRGRGNSYGRGQGCGFNFMKQKVWGKCEALGSDIYLIGNALQADNNIKTREVTLNHIHGNQSEGKDVKEELEELNHFNSNIIKPETPDIITTRGSVKEIILRKEVKNWSVQNIPWE